MSRKDELFSVCYQMAGHLLLASDDLTQGQKERLTELLLNVLAEPDRYKADVVRDLRMAALKP